MSYLYKKRFFFELLCVTFISVILSFLIIKSSGNGKVLKIIIGGLICLTALIVIPGREQILVYLLTFMLPLNLRKFLVYAPACNMDVVREVHKRVLDRYTPLYRIQQIEGFAVYGFDIIFFILISIWIYRLTINHKLNILFFPHITIPFFLIFILAVFGILHTDLSLLIKFSSLYEMTKCWIMLIYVANNISRDRRMIYFVVGAILLSGLFQAFIGIGQYFTKAPLGLQFLGENSSLMIDQSDNTNIRISGTLGHPNKLAIFLGIMLQLNIACLFAKLPDNFKWYIRWMYIIPFVPMLFTLFASYSRSGWFSFLLGGAINCSWCMIRRTGKKVFSIIIVWGFFISFAAMVFIISESVRNRILMDDQGASEIRKPLAQVAENVIYNNPWLGIGLNNYTSCYPKYDNTTTYWLTGIFPEVVHNEFLLILAELGIPSFILFLYIMTWSFFTLCNISRTDIDPLMPYIAIGLFSGFISWIMHSQKEYQYVFFTTRFWFNIGIIVAMKYFISNRLKQINYSAPPKDGVKNTNTTPTQQLFTVKSALSSGYRETEGYLQRGGVS